MVEVRQEDREAYLAMNMLPEFDAADVRAGLWDKVTGLQAFARHRIAARDAALEEAAKVVEKWIEPVMATPHENATYRSIATAIRALKGPSDA